MPAGAARPDAADGDREGAVPLAASAPDGTGGVIYVWADSHNGESYDIFAQRVGANGDTLWPAGGLPVCAATHEQVHPALIPDGGGGAIIAWDDARSGTYWEIYAQRLSADGVPQWTPDGVSLCTSTQGVVPPVLAADGASGAVVAWDDTRSGPSLYAQKVNAAGVPQWAEGGVALCSTPCGPPDAIVSDGAGGAIVAWTLYSASTDDDIYAQRVSADGSPQWGAGGTALIWAGRQYAHVLIADGVGGAVLAWADGRSGVSFDIYAQRLDATGAPQWAGGGVAVCAAAYDQSYPVAISDGAGGAIVAWTDGRSGAGAGLYAQRVNAAGAPLWPADGVALCAGTCYRYGSSAIAPDDAGGALVAWMDTRGSSSLDLYAQRVSPAGAPLWPMNGAPLCTVAGHQLEPALIPDGAGGAVALWSDWRNILDADLYAQKVNALGVVQWAADGMGVRVSEVQSLPVCLDSDAGSVILAWQEKRGGTYDIVVRKLDAAGAPLWPAVVVCGAPGPQWFPSLVSDGAGGAIVGWEDWRSGVSFYAQRVSAAGVPQWADNGVALCPATYVKDAALVADGAGGAVVAWTDGRKGTDLDLYVQRVNSAGVLQWTIDGVAVSTVPLVAVTPALLADGVGGVTVAWSEMDPGTYETDLYAQRVSSTGVPQWIANGVALCTAALDQNNPAIVSDGAGGTIVTWEDLRQGYSVRIYAQRVSPAGVPLWTAGGAPVRSGPYDGRNFSVASDGAGGAIISWENWGLDPYASDIYAQRVGSAGALLWSTTGVGLCSITGSGRHPVILADGAGGAIVTWEDSRSGTHSDLYAQRVNSAGALQWTAAGAVVCAAPGGQRAPAAASDGAGGAVIAWQDSRNGTLDHIRAQRLDGSGVAQWSADGVTSTVISLVSVAAEPGLVRLIWRWGGGGAVTATIHREAEGSAWVSLGSVAADGSGQIHFEDRTVAPGGRYGYRVGIMERGTVHYYGETWVEVPGRLELALEGLRPNPADADLQVALTLPVGGAAHLELVDVTGRQVRAWRLEGLGAGRHVRRLGSAADLAPGVYLLRLTHGKAAVTRRVSVVH